MTKYSLLTIVLLSLVSLAALSDQAIAVPIQDANLVMWLDGQDIDGDGIAEGAGETYITGTTATWADKSAGGTRSATQSTTGTLAPSVAVGSHNGVNTLSFDGGDKMAFANIDILSVPGVSIFVVGGRNNTNTSQLLSSNTDNQQFRLVAGPNRLEMTGSPNNLGVPQVSGDINVFTLAQAEVTPSTSRVALKGTFGTTDGHANTTFDLNQIGARASLSEPINGNIGEVVIYNRVLNSAERIITENHLNSKFDLDNNGASPIAADRYAGDLSTNGDYDFQAFGIGQVDGSNSLSTGSSAGLQISATSGLGDGDFYMAGHKTLANNSSVTDLPSDLTWRMERVWYLDKTDVNNSANLDLTFNLNEAGVISPGLKDFFLLYSATNAFESSESPFTTIGLPSMLMGDEVTFSLGAGALADGYYTLGFAQAPIPEPSTWIMLVVGLAGLIRQRSRKS